ncbi:MAG: Hsp20/alpha crystallin family protein [Planctomycetaceae bacterium]
MSTNTDLKTKEANSCCGSECKEEAKTVDSLVYSPDVDIVETDSGIDLTFDMPGVDQEHLDISVEKDVLTVVGHAEHTVEEGYQYLYREFYSGDYRRAFRLPDSIDARNRSKRRSRGS